MEKVNAFVNAKTSMEKNEFLFLCQFNTSPQLKQKIETFIKHGVDVSAKNPMGWNALQILCVNNSSSELLEILSILIENGVDVNETTNNGERAIDLVGQCVTDEDHKLKVIKFLVRHGAQVHKEDETKTDLIHINFFKPNHYGNMFLQFLAKKKIRLGWHKNCENCREILSIDENARMKMQHHWMFGNCYKVFKFLMKRLEELSESTQDFEQFEMAKNNPTYWLRERAKHFNDYEVMADVSEQVKNGVDSSLFNCDNYERYLTSMHSIAKLLKCDESIAQIEWFFLLPFHFPNNHNDEKNPELKKAKIEWEKTLFNLSHMETDKYFGKFRKEDANEGFFLPKEFKHKCHGGI